MDFITSWERMGMEKGELIGRILQAQRFLKQPQTPRDELALLSVEELTKQADELERRVASKVNGTP
jgi:hypothetical protein